MSSSPTPSQLPNATTDSRGAVTHATWGWNITATWPNPPFTGGNGFRFDFPGQGPVMLQDGRFLAAGADTIDGSKAVVISADAKTTMNTNPLNTPRADSQMLCVLNNGDVLLQGGDITPTDVESWNPGSEVWTVRAASFASIRGGLVALDNGKALLMGGIDTFSGGTIQSQAALYDQTTHLWTATGSMVTPRMQFALPMRIPGGVIGNVFVAGGITTGGITALCEMYQGDFGTWVTRASMTFDRADFAIVRLPGVAGKLMVIGGYGSADPNALPFCEVYSPTGDFWTTVAKLNYGRAQHNAVALSDGRVVVIGGRHGTENDLQLPTEIYDPVFNTWSVLLGSPGNPSGAVQGVGVNYLQGSQGLNGVLAINSFNDFMVGHEISVLGQKDAVLGLITEFDPTAAINQVSLNLGQVGPLQALKTLISGLTFDTAVNPIALPGYRSVSFEVANPITIEQLTAPPPNHIVNGAFDFWQRGTIIADTHTGAAGLYNGANAADRWGIAIRSLVVAASGNAMQVSRELTDTTYLTDSHNRSRYFMRMQLTAATDDGTMRFTQEIERDRVRRLRGKSIVPDFLVSISPTFLGFNFVQLRLRVTSNPADELTNWENWVGGSDLYLLNGFSFAFNPLQFRFWGESMFTNLYVTVPGDAVAMAWIFEAEFDTSQVGNYYDIAEATLTETLAVRDPSFHWNFEYASGSLEAELATCRRYFSKSYLPDNQPGFAPDFNNAVNASFAYNVNQAFLTGVALPRIEHPATPFMTSALYSPSTGVAFQGWDGAADTPLTFDVNGQILATALTPADVGSAISYHWTVDMEFPAA